MCHLLLISALAVLTLSPIAFAAKPKKLVIDVPSALAVSPVAPPLDTPASANFSSTDNEDASEPEAQTFQSPKEFFNKVRLGSWKWENGSALQLTGDRVKLSYGEKTRFDLTVRPFKDDGTVQFTIKRGF